MQILAKQHSLELELRNVDVLIIGLNNTLIDLNCRVMHLILLIIISSNEVICKVVCRIGDIRHQLLLCLNVTIGLIYSVSILLSILRQALNVGTKISYFCRSLPNHENANQSCNLLIRELELLVVTLLATTLEHLKGWYHALSIGNALT